ncbi:MAG: beta strand repeat-containing protein, partial [Bryobacteraceae bacterium]
MGIPASAQFSNSFNCAASVAGPPVLRAEGLAELTGDVVLTCSGGPPVGTTTVNVQIFLNTSVTSRLLNGNASEAVLLVNEPPPNAQAFGVNIFQGSLVAFNSLAFPGVILPPAGSTGVILRITNVRADATGVSAGSSLAPSSVMETVSVSSGATISNPNQTVGFVGGPGAGSAQCSSVASTSAAFTVNFSEAFATAFKLQGGGPPTVPGTVNNTESGFIPATTSGATLGGPVATLAGAGQADFATRVQLAFTNIGRAATLLVPTTLPPNGVIGSTAKAVLVASDTQLTTPGAAPAPLVAATTTIGGNPYAQITTTGGAATATYEIVATNSSVIETFAVPVFLNFAATSGTGVLANVAVGFVPAPVVTSSLPAAPPIPRFSASPFFTGTLDSTGCAASIAATAGTPQSAAAGTAFATALQATVRDGGNNPVNGATVTFTAPASGASGAFAGDGNMITAQTNAAGVATAPAFTANCSLGSYPVNATLVGLANSAAFNLTNTPGPPAAVTAVSGGGQNASLGAVFANPLVAGVKDACGNPVPGANVTFTAPASGPSATFGTGGTISATVAANASGIATSPALTANGIAGGPYNVRATITGTSSTANFPLSNNIVTTATVVTSSLSPSTLSQPVTLTATVTSSGATGKVTFSFGTMLIGTAAVTTSGKATLTTRLLPSGTAALRAIYGGDATHAASTSAAVSQTVKASPASSFTPLVNYATQSAPESIAQADFNGDGIPDLAIVNGSSNTITVLLGNGTGGFTPAPSSPFAVGTSPFSVAVGDFNGDGKPDLAVANASNSVTVLLGSGNGGFAPAPGSPFTVRAATSLAVADFNGDGLADIVVVGSQSNFTGLLTVLLGDGGGGFATAPGSPSTISVSPTDPHSLAVGDFNGDGVSDIAVADTDNAGQGGNKVAVFLGNGSGAFTPAPGSPFIVGSNPTAVAVGDFNGDGNADLAIANRGSNDVTVLLGNGSGGFTPVPGSPFPTGSPGSPFGLAVGDFNGDGNIDLAVSNFSDGVAVLLGNGSGGFIPEPGSPFVVGINPRSMAVGDFNGDGKTDLAVANNGSNNVTVLLGIGPPSAITATPGTTPQSTFIGSPFANALQATVQDASGNPVGGVTVTFAAPASGASGTFAGGGNTATATAPTNASGVATAPTFTANAIVGGYTVNASVAGVAAPAMFNLTNTPPLAITSISPPSATAGGPAFPLTVNGTSFLPTSTVLFGSAILTPTSVNAAGTQLIVTIPANLITQPGPVGVTVLNVSARSNAVTFQIGPPPPVVSSLTPNTAAAGIGGFTLTIAGSNFASNATVSFNGQTLTPTSITGAQLTVAVPAALVAAPGTVNVTVTSAGLTSAAASFTITPAGTGPPTSGNIIITGHDDDYHASSATLSNGDTPSLTAKAQLAAIVNFARAAAPAPTLPVLIFDQGTELQEVLTSLAVPFVRVDPSVGIPDPALFDTAKYSAIGVASDKSCGPCDNDNTSSVNLAAAKASFQAFVSAGGGIFAFAAAGSNTYYNFLPKPVVKFNFFQNSGFQATSVGTQLGIPATNGDYAHDTFPQPGTGGLDPEWEVVETYTGSVPVTLAIEGVRITTGCPLPSGTVNVAYPSLTLAETGLRGNLTWSIAAGALPNGLNLVNGAIGGTPTVAGTSSFVLSLTDGTRTTTKSCGVAINGPLMLTGVCPTVVPFGASVSIPLTASGGDGNYTLVYTSGPAWLSLSATTGVLTAIGGTPPAPGVYPFTVTLTDHSGTPAFTFSCSVTVLPALTLNGNCPTTTTPLGSQFTLPLTAGGGSGTYQLSLGTSAAWLSLSATTGTAPANGTFAVTVSGMPPAAGTYPFTVTLGDNAGSAPKTFPCSVIVTSQLRLSGMCPATPIPQGILFTLGLTAAGGNGNYRLVSSAPPWLVLGSATGPAPANGTFQTALAGIPPAGGSFPFTVTLSDTGQSSPVSVTCNPFVVLPPLTISGACPAPSGTRNAPYSLPFSISGGNGNYLISSTTPVLSLAAATGTAPAGGVFNDSLGGTFTTSGVYSAGVQVSDTGGSKTVVYSCNIAISSPSVAIASGCPAGSVVQGTQYSQPLSATGGDGNFSWSIPGGGLPAGLQLVGNTISGTAAGPPGKSSFIIQVSSGGTSDQLSCSITVAPPPLHLTTGCPGDGVQGQPYPAFTLAATGGLGAGNYAFSVIGGGLPSGLTLNGSTIAGTPSGPPGASSFRIQVASGTQTDTTGQCSLNIGPQLPALTLTGVCPATPFLLDSPVTLTAMAAGGNPPYSFRLTSGQPWLTPAPNGSTVTLTGRAPNAGSFPVALEVADKDNKTAQYSCTVQVVPGPLQITNATCPGAVNANSMFTTMLSASGGGSSYTWKLNPDAPPWLMLTATTGPNVSLTGTPPAQGTFPFTVTLSDNAGSTPVSFPCTL